MYLKPKNNNEHNGLLYKRFLSLESSKGLSILYKTTDNKYWTFDYNVLDFVQFTDILPSGTQIVNITATMVLTYLANYMYYTTEWVITQTFDTTGYTLLSAKYGNIGKYQMNKYYYSGNFSYMIKGDTTGTTGQRIKGLIAPMTNFTIRTFDDNLIISADDLIVIGDRLYSVEDTGTTIKKPSNYKIYYATLNSIL